MLNLNLDFEKSARRRLIVTSKRTNYTAVSSLLAMTGEKERRQLSDQLAADKGAGVTVGKEPSIFRFNFWQYGSWQEVVVDDRLPTRRGQLQYTSGTTSSEFWCALLEKAYAKLYGCYEAIEGGSVHDALLDMTSGITEIVELKTACCADKLTNILAASFNMETIMGAAIHVYAMY